MVFGIPLLMNRVAPRCAAAEELLLVTVSGGRVTDQRTVPIDTRTSMGLIDILLHHHVATLVCGGIPREIRESIEGLRVTVVDNVACSSAEIVVALEAGALQPGFGFGGPSHQQGGTPTPGKHPSDSLPAHDVPMDCLACSDRVCLSGKDCRRVPEPSELDPPEADLRVLDAAADVALEREPQLCRLAELVYFGLEMEYHKIGVAFCVDLLEPARVLTSVLRRFFEVVPVCCKIGGHSLDEVLGAGNDQAQDDSVVICNPKGQARVLNQAATDLNVIVGLCIGTDCIFTRESAAPVTTLFVKDRSLANNPIGALYSEYYLRESVAPSGATFPHRPQLRRSPGGVT